jgi:hypothetical protein
MFSTLRAACLLFATVVVAFTAPTQSTAGKVFQLSTGGYTMGGSLDAYYSYVYQHRQAGNRFEINGAVCQSSCTLFLGVGDVCVGPHTRFGFHAPSHGGLFRANPKLEARAVAAMSEMYSQGHPALGPWFEQNALHKILTMTHLTGQQLHDHFGFDLCPRSDASTVEQFSPKATVR